MPLEAALAHAAPQLLPSATSFTASVTIHETGKTVRGCGHCPLQVGLSNDSGVSQIGPSFYSVDRLDGQCPIRSTSNLSRARVQSGRFRGHVVKCCNGRRVPLPYAGSLSADTKSLHFNFLLQGFIKSLLPSRCTSDWRTEDQHP